MPWVINYFYVFATYFLWKTLTNGYWCVRLNKTIIKNERNSPTIFSFRVRLVNLIYSRPTFVLNFYTLINKRKRYLYTTVREIEEQTEKKTCRILSSYTKNMKTYRAIDG